MAAAHAAVPARRHARRARAAAAVLAHCRAVIDAAGPACVAVKPQLACFERLGAAGWTALARDGRARAGRRAARPRRRQARRHRRQRGRLRAGARRRARRRPSGRSRASAWTRSPPIPTWERTRSTVLADAARRAGAGVFVLVRTSNPGAADVEDLALDGGGTVWERVAALVDALGGRGAQATGALSDVGAVVGATAPEHVGRLRELMPRAPFLLPGIGAQGGRVEDLAPAFAPGPRRRARHRVAVDRLRPRTGRRGSRRAPHGPRPSGCAPPPGRSPEPIAWDRNGSATTPRPRALAFAPMNRRKPSRWLAPLAILVVGAGGRGDPQRAAQRRRRRRPHDRLGNDDQEGRRDTKKKPTADRLRRAQRRHALVDLDRDGRPGRRACRS